MNPFLALAAGVVIVSFASIMIRLAQADGVSSLAIAAWRLAFASAVLAPIALARRRDELARLDARAWALALASGAFLAAHFASWTLSLAHTSVASSTALVTTNPIWLGVASWLLLGERPSGRLAAGIALAMAGSAMVFLADAQAPATPAASPMFGNLLALLGSLTVCGYLLIGRSLRARMSLVAYVSVVYLTAAIGLMAAAAASGPVTGFPASAWLLLIGLALGPQLLGHTAFNFALKHVSATVVAVAVLGEPIGSSLLAWALFGEAIGPTKLAGMALLLAGIYLAARAEAASTLRARRAPGAARLGAETTP